MMNGKGSSAQDRQGISQRTEAGMFVKDRKAFKLGNLLRWASAGLAAGMMVVGLYQSAAATVFSVSDVCDMFVVPPKGANAGVKGPHLIEALPGDIIQLTAPSLCTPVIGSIFDPKTKTTVTGLVSGNGINITAPGIILDLNGHNITSTKDILAEAKTLGLDVRNTGVSVGAGRTTVTNTNATVATVDNFTGEFKYGKGSSFSMLVGGLFDVDGNPATPKTRVQNLVGSNDHGDGVLAIESTQNIWVDSVQLIGQAPNGGFGVNWLKCTGPGGVIQNSLIEGVLSGVSIKSCTSGGYELVYNYIESPAGDGVVVKGVKGLMIAYNTIELNAHNGVNVGIGSETISVQKNTIQNNEECGILVSRAAKSVITAPNTFAFNGLGGASGPTHTEPVVGLDVCFK